ncbi:MAG: hypothetical protein J6Y02_12570 [Pseudobutyrivibrio sp.]|nr:hypothetical protein [Pseudobutyrivibrio sp.]
MKTYSFWRVVATIVAIRFAVEFTEGFIKALAHGLYRAGSFGKIFNELEKAGYDIGQILADDDDNYEFEDKVVGFKTPRNED